MHTKILECVILVCVVIYCTCICIMRTQVHYFVRKYVCMCIVVYDNWLNTGAWEGLHEWSGQTSRNVICTLLIVWVADNFVCAFMHFLYTLITCGRIKTWNRINNSVILYKTETQFLSWRKVIWMKPRPAAPIPTPMQ